MRNIARTEIDADWVDYDSYDKARNLEQNDYSTEEAAFTVEDKIKLKDLFEDIQKSSQFFTKFRYDGKYHFTYIKREYTNSDVVETIKSTDCLNYSYKLSEAKNIKSRVKLSYHYDYGVKKHKASMQDNVDNYNLYAGGTSYDLDRYGLSTLDMNGNETHNRSTLEIKSKYIRSKHIWEMSTFAVNFDFNTESGYTKDDGYATQFIKYKLLSSCQQKLIITCDFPLSYLWLETGDVIKFDELLGGITAYGNDYTKLSAINGMWCYPAFMCTKISKSLDKVKAEFTQLWYLNDNDNHGWDISDEVSEEELEALTSQVFGCTNPQALNYNPFATDDNDSCIFTADPSGDGVTNVVDIVYLVNHIFGIATIPSSQFASSDVNGDGLINVVDVVAMVNIILGTHEGVTIGCTDPNAVNYNSEAISDDGSCVFPVMVCPIPNADNYESSSDNGVNVSDESICNFASFDFTTIFVMHNPQPPFNEWYNFVCQKINMQIQQFDGDLIRYDGGSSMFDLNPTLPWDNWTIQDRFEMQEFQELGSHYHNILQAQGVEISAHNMFKNVWQHKYIVGHPLGWEGIDQWGDEFDDAGLGSEFSAMKASLLSEFSYVFMMAPNLLAIYSIPELHNFYVSYLGYPENIEGTNIGLNELSPYKNLINNPRAFNLQTTGPPIATDYNIQKSVIQGSLVKDLGGAYYNLHCHTWGNVRYYGASCSVVLPIEIGTVSSPINYSLYFDEVTFDEPDDSFEVIVMRMPAEDHSTLASIKTDFSVMEATYGFKTITSYPYSSFGGTIGEESTPYSMNDGQGNSNQVLAHSFYNVSQPYDSWGNSLMNSQTMPKLTFSIGSFIEDEQAPYEQKSVNNIVIHIVYHGSNTQQWCRFKSPRLVKEESNGL